MMMTKIKHLMALAVLFPLTMSAQKLFTLEDLNHGGNNYRNLLPENKWFVWWGDELVRIDDEECYLVDKKTGKDLRPLTADEVKERNRDKRPDTVKEDHQLFVIDIDGNKHQLTTDGSRDIVYGSAVHRNEFGIEKGIFWSPDSSKLAFYRMDQSMVADYPQVDIFQREATHEPDKYPMAGETSHDVTIGVYDIRTGKTVYLQTPNGSVFGGSAAESTITPDASAAGYAPVYFSNISWSPDGNTIYLFELNRDQNDCRLVSYDAVTGLRLQELYRETSDKYVEPQTPIQFLPWDDTKFIMQSQKDGFNHLYLFDVNGKELKQLTSGPWVVLDVLGFNKKRKSVIIASNEVHPLQRNTYSVDIKTGRRTLLDNGRGVHRGELSNSGQWFIDRYSEPTVPRCITVASTTPAASTASTVLLTAPDPWADYQQPRFECGSIKAADGKTDLYYRMVKPHNFDAQKKYPTVVYVYGGPHAHNVEASWHWASRSWETYMAQKGYIIFILDNRGSENRGRDFEQVTFRQLGQVEMQDQMKGVEFLKSLPYVDADRMGVHGWSFGGFMTITLMLNHPDIFKVGVAGGPVIDWKFYEVMYGERYMDTPQTNPEGYEKTSLLNKAGNLKGKLQIITGYNDPTVVPQNCLSFLDACIKAGTQPDFFAYPGEAHNMRGHASVHLHERITQYFEDYLK